MKLLVDEMPYFRSDCPFCEDGHKQDTCHCGAFQKECTYFVNGRNPEDCPHLKAQDNTDNQNNMKG